MRCLQAHVPFGLQFLTDNNLYGMNYLNASSAKFRGPLPATAPAGAVDRPPSQTQGTFYFSIFPHCYLCLSVLAFASSSMLKFTIFALAVLTCVGAKQLDASQTLYYKLYTQSSVPASCVRSTTKQSWCDLEADVLVEGCSFCAVFFLFLFLLFVRCGRYHQSTACTTYKVGSCRLRHEIGSVPGSYVGGSCVSLCRRMLRNLKFGAVVG